jgi:GGDEF domain-containing protein
MIDFDGDGEDQEILVPLSRRTVGFILNFFARSQHDRRMLNRELDTDELTHLGNRRALKQAVPSVDANPSMSWCTFDGNAFGQVNKKHNETEGDRALQHFAQAMNMAATEVRIPERGFRISGDEFAYAVPSSEAEHFIAAVERLSVYRTALVETSLTGAAGETYQASLERLAQRKRDRSQDG